MSISIAKVARNFQVTVPREIRKVSGLQEGELVNFEVRNGEIIMTPVCIVKKEQAYIFSPRWQKAIRKAATDYRSRQYKSYRNGKEMKKDLG